MNFEKLKQQEIALKVLELVGTSENNIYDALLDDAVKVLELGLESMPTPKITVEDVTWEYKVDVKKSKTKKEKAMPFISKKQARFLAAKKPKVFKIHSNPLM